jgi:hypothetical protein
MCGRRPARKSHSGYCNKLFVPKGIILNVYTLEGRAPWLSALIPHADTVSDNLPTPEGAWVGPESALRYPTVLSPAGCLLASVYLPWHGHLPPPQLPCPGLGGMDMLPSWLPEACVWVLASPLSGCGPVSASCHLCSIFVHQRCDLFLSSLSFPGIFESRTSFILAGESVINPTVQRTLTLSEIQVSFAV